MERVSFDQLLVAAQVVWGDKEVVKKVAFDSRSILKQAESRKVTFFAGRSSRAIVSGLFYLLGFRYDAVQKQKDLAKILGTTEMTVRKSYREWLNVFPDLFVDVIGKFTQDDQLRYFVLFDMKQAQKVSQH